jgi:acyl-CoA synthetase (AMP-forming)/AMP-acid ligase II
MLDDAADPPTLVDACRRRAVCDSDRRGYTFLADGVDSAHELSFGELDSRARAVAAAIAEHVQPGARALLHYPSGLDFVVAFFGCLYAGVTAVPMAQIDGASAGGPLLARCRAIAESAAPDLLLSVRSSLERLDPQQRRLAGLDGLEALATDAVDDAWAARWRMPEIDGDTIAYLQYSSGSTGVPKGVMLTHRSVLHNLASIRDLCGVGRNSAGALWLPMFHDMGLVAGVLMPVHSGGHMKLMSPMSFLKRPHRWLAALSEPGAISAAPNFAYELCAQRVSDRQLAELDLSGWGCAIVGAERVRPATLERFARRFAASGFRSEAFAPCYGLAESTLLVTGGPLGRRPTVRPVALEALARHDVAPATDGETSVALAGCGSPRPGMRVVVVDPGTLRPMPPGRVGEICISGESLGIGYFGAPESTAQAFGVELEGIPGSFLRTGDLGALADGELFVTGRCKELIIIDGSNHYPPDLEATAEAAHPAIRRGSCAVVAVDDGDRERVVVLAELTGRAIRDAARGGDTVDGDAEVTGALRRALSSGHGVALDDVVLLRPGSLPVTSSGKLQRVACRSRYLAGQFEDRRVHLTAQISTGRAA